LLPSGGSVPIETIELSDDTKAELLGDLRGGA
jgi:hypothetical protein